VRLYIDTGVVAAYYLPDPASVEAEDLLHAFPSPAISDLSEVELLAALARRVRRAQLAAADALRVRTLFLTHLEGGLFTRVALRRRHFHLAREWAGRHGVDLDPAGALHLAAATLEERTLATTDPALVLAGRELGVDVLAVATGEFGTADINETLAPYLVAAEGPGAAP
jgi:predicted nucleic acid-binding protein